MPTLLPPPVRNLTRRHARAKVKRPSPQQANERPRYPALARGVAVQTAKVQTAFDALVRDWFRIVGLDDPGKAVKNIGIQDHRDLDAAIETFMERMAGRKPRARVDFIAAGEDALIQETNFLGYRIGSVRGAEQVGLPGGDPDLTRLQQGRLAERAYERLTEDGVLRFETRLDAIKQAMWDGLAAGENPLAIAKELRGDLDGYNAGRLRTLVRTEMAISAEAATAEKYREAGVTQFNVIGDPGTDALCVGFQEGGPYQLDDTESMPPYHPNCFDSIVPLLPD